LTRRSKLDRLPWPLQHKQLLRVMIIITRGRKIIIMTTTTAMIIITATIIITNIIMIRHLKQLNKYMSTSISLRRESLLSM